MRPSIENIVNVKGGGNWEFQVIAIHMGMDEEISCSCAWVVWSLLLVLAVSSCNQILHFLVNSPWKCKGDMTTSGLWKEPV